MSGGVPPRFPGARRIATPVLLFAAAALAAHAVGFRMEIPWTHFQILDRWALLEDPLGALWLLHTQPPALNALLALCLRLAAAIGGAPESWLGGVYLALGLTQAILFHDLVRRASGSAGWAAVATAALVAEPAFHFYGHHGWYPFLVRTEVVALGWATMRLFESGSRRFLSIALALAVLLPLTRALFHPAWSLAFAAALLWTWHRRFPERAGGARGWLVPAVLFLGALSLWPLKNALVFGRFTYSTLTGVNLARITDVDQREWLAYQGQGRIPPQVERHCEQFERRYGPRRAAVVTATAKSDGSRNWNHLMVLHSGPDLTRRSLRWRFEHPGRWMLYGAVQYFMWARAAHVLSYKGTVRGPDSRAYHAWARAWERLWFTDARRPIEALAPGLAFHRYTILRANGKPLPYTLFALLWFPLGLVLAARRLASRTFRASSAAPLLVLSLAAVLWTMLVPSLTDGIEGNRMRFSTAPLWLLVLLLSRPRVGRRGAPASVR